MLLLGYTSAISVEKEWFIWTNLDDVAFFEWRMGIGHCDQIMRFEGQMQARLIAKMLDPLNKTILAFALHNLLGTKPDMGRMAWRTCK